ncbi:MAG: hypothetical protein EOP50_04745 [Sphingobacteriales bacterium]|nr:MAG: hypothetical protein EOP50_04745 [Sphingobacteriales bacterium]
MKIKFYCFKTVSENKLHVSIWRTATIGPLGDQSFNKFLLSALGTDFIENRFGDVDETLQRVSRIERGELDQYEWEGQGFTHHITRSRVRFEHSVFGECPEWPIWCCTLAQYKAALEGYRRFLDMPASIDSELIVELPDGEPTDC